MTLFEPQAPAAPVSEVVSKFTSAELRAGLRARFKPPEYAYFDEVSNGTGMQKTGAADALAMSVWPSRGLELLGFEIKVSRADWLRELKNPAKAERVFLQCDRWYLVVGDIAIVATGELPSTWGLMAPKGGRLVVVREAPKLEPKPVSRALLASLLRRCAEPETALVDAAVRQALAERDAAWKPDRDREIRKAQDAALRHQQEAETLRKAISDFEAASGVRLIPWQAGKIGKAVALVQSGGAAEYRREMEEIRNRAERLAASVERVLANTEEGADDA